jgi:hypothetical protein
MGGVADTSGPEPEPGPEPERDREPQPDRWPERDRDPEPDPDVLASGREGPGAYELWSALPIRLRRTLRRTVLTGVCLAVLAGGAYAISALPEPASEAHPRPSPSPTVKRLAYPAQTARITFSELRIDEAEQRTFTIELRASATSALTVLGVSQGYEAVDLRLAHRPPITVGPDSPRALTLHARITNCDGVPFHARSPFLDVTLRNDRARQKLSVIPGERYTRSLTHAFRTLCGRSRTATAANP